MAQRNIAWAPSGNPGSAATRTVEHPFDILPTHATGDSAGEPQTPALQVTSSGMRGTHPEKGVATGPDELMFVWNTIPRETVASVYLPELDAVALAREAAQRHGARVFRAVDAHTLQCRIGDINYLPLPEQRASRLTGLLTLELPEGVRKGQEFSTTVRQYSGATHAVVGAFEVHVTVKAEASILPDEANRFAVLSHIASTLAASDRWTPVLARYLSQISARVEALGGHPQAIAPSPYGTNPPPTPGGTPVQSPSAAGRSCRWWVGLFLIIALVLVVLLWWFLH